MKATTKSVHTVLEETKKVLQDKGWCQYRFMNERGNVCLNEALVLASGPDCTSNFIPARRAIFEHLNCIPLTMWNDEKGRTKQQVLDMLDVVIGKSAEVGKSAEESIGEVV